MNPREHKILYVSDRYRDNVCGTELSMFNEMQRRGFDVHYYQKRGVKGKHFINGKRIIPILQEGNFTDLWIVHSWVAYHKLTLRRINDLGVHVVGFGLADPPSFAPHKLKQVNLYASNDLEVSEELHQQGFPSLFFPTGCNVKFHKKLSVRKTTDILVYGTGLHPNLPSYYRVEIVKAILERFPDKKIKIYGKRWYDLECEPPIHGEELIEEINKAKISLDICSEGGQLARRIFECGACGTAVITGDNPEIHKLFTPGENILTYSTVEELLEKIDYLLKSRYKRKELAKKLYKVCTTQHDIRNRVDLLLDVVSAARKKWELTNITNQHKITKADPKFLRNLVKPIKKNSASKAATTAKKRALHSFNYAMRKYRKRRKR